MMYRAIMPQLEQWKKRNSRKPLIINGARQVGKSWIVEHFGNESFNGNIHIVNFEKRRDIHSIFEKNFDVRRIKMELEITFNTSIHLSRDLVFFDEIQSCPFALSSLRYFYEDMPNLHLIAAGSLLDFEFRNVPFPVGRVEMLDMHPMTFYEFLIAKGKTSLANILKEPFHQISDSLEGILKEELNQYIIVGGMPECVNVFLKTRNIEQVKKIQDELIYSFNQDFKKYHPMVNNDCLNDILLNSANLIGNQIIYTKLSDRFSSPTIKKGVEVLGRARLLHKVANVSLAGLPLVTSGKRFKLFYLDIGLFIRLSKLNYQEKYISKNLIASFKGALAEQFVAQQLMASQTDSLQYWSRTNPGSSAEIDLVVIRNGEIIPIEIKSGKSGSLKSLHILFQSHQNIHKSYVLSQSKYGIRDNIHFLPIYYAGFI